MFLTQGKCQWCSVERFEIQYNNVLENLRPIIPNIILLTPAYIDEKIYGEDNVIQYKKYTNVVKRIAEEQHIWIIFILMPGATKLWQI